MNDEKPAPVKIVSLQKKASADAALELFISGTRLYHQGAYDAAAKEFATAAELVPTKAKYVYFQALATYQKGDVEAAAALVKNAVQIEEANPGENWGRMMERVQGPHRLWVEEVRRQQRDAIKAARANADNALAN